MIACALGLTALNAREKTPEGARHMLVTKAYEGVQEQASR
uniref:Uncharacterized protein n=1 Tax=Ralstonia solanacearum TaxID=305 RepID=A0A0S4W8T5_RALSL|nr:protein of unknown function [Ralstonia solanacearum]